ncbi:hypothetical protein Tco_1114642 [Tanacetum coccineum]|uniref:Uncharacterized protein n=1 Tax=Tanacetum coccineum TaxID=301880 RepID=A0ABQ5IZC5_9ASTR
MLVRPRFYWSHGGTFWRSGLPIVVVPSKVVTFKRVMVHPVGLKLARENLQSRVKEEDSITEVENTIFDLGVMDSLLITLAVLISKFVCCKGPSNMHYHTQACTECTRWVFCKLYGRPRERHPVCPTKRHDFRLRSFRILFKPDWDYLNLPTCLWVICGGETMSDSIFKHDLCKIASSGKMAFRKSLMIARWWQENLAKRDLRNLQSIGRALIGGE